MPTQKVKVCSSDKPWVSRRMKAVVSRRQWAFKTHGKASAVFKMYRNKEQKEVRNCKRFYYRSKVSSFKETNLSKWWTEVKAIGGLSVRSEWWHQLIDCATPTIYALCEKFNVFLDSLTSHFSPLHYRNRITCYCAYNDLIGGVWCFHQDIVLAHEKMFEKYSSVSESSLNMTREGE